VSPGFSGMWCRQSIYLASWLESLGAFGGWLFVKPSVWTFD
jgi:hypothetical protein